MRIGVGLGGGVLVEGGVGWSNRWGQDSEGEGSIVGESRVFDGGGVMGESGVVGGVLGQGSQIYKIVAVGVVIDQGFREIQLGIGLSRYRCYGCYSRLDIFVGYSQGFFSLVYRYIFSGVGIVYGCGSYLGIGRSGTKR